jgi:hypothetical protein
LVIKSINIPVDHQSVKVYIDCVGFVDFGLWYILHMINKVKAH